MCKCWHLLSQAETKDMVIERIKLDEAQARAALAEPRHDEGDINTDEEPENDLGENRDFDQWRLRELARIARLRSCCLDSSYLLSDPTISCLIKV